MQVQKQIHNPITQRYDGTIPYSQWHACGHNAPEWKWRLSVKDQEKASDLEEWALYSQYIVFDNG